MISSRRVALAAFVFTSLSVFSTRAAVASPSVSSIVVGRPSPVAVVATRDFVFEDATASAEQRRQRVARVPLVVRVDATAADAAALALQKDFETRRSRFLAAMQREAEKHDTESATLPPAAWRELLSEQAGSLSPFPLDDALASAWAAGGSGEHTLAAWGGLLRAGLRAMRVRADELPSIEGGFPASALLVDAAWREMDGPASGETALLSQVVPLSQARTRFVSGFKGGPPALARHLAQFIRPDSIPDVAATLRLRVEAAMSEGAAGAETIRRGQVLVHEGETLTPRTLAMIEAMRRGEVPAPATGQRPLLIAVSALSGAVIFALWWLVGRRRTGGPSEAVVIVDDEPVSAGLVAAPTREELLALLREEFVSTLVEQRQTMMDAQQRAHMELAHLERRLGEFQAPLQSRLDAYEQRIADLEQELHRQGDENRELLQATIELMQQKVREAKAGGRVTLN